MPLNANVRSQLASQMGLGRPGGAASRGSNPASSTKGSNFAALENALLKKGVKKPADAKKVTAGKPGRQFFNQASGGDSALSKPSSDKAIKSQPGGPLQGAWARNYSGGGF